jgi:hypothetical protein
MRNGTAYRLPPLVRLTDVTESGSWPTPDAMLANDGENPETWLARRERVKLTAKNGNGMGMPLAIAARLWPTPRANDAEKRGNISEDIRSGLPSAVKFWRTPQARDGDPRGQQSPEKRKAGGHSVSLAEQVMFPTPAARDYRSGMSEQKLRQREAESSRGVNLSEHLQRLEGNNGTLNPTWVEWLMGFPLGWTDLKVWATRSSRNSRKSSAARSSQRKQQQKPLITSSD